MSATVYDLCVNITSNSTEAVRGINDVGSSTEGLSAKTVAMGKLMADAFEMVISKVAEYGQKIISVGMDQESALAKVNTIMDQSVMSTQQMSDAISSLSSEMGVSVTELSDTVYNAISATGDTANAVALAGQASKLATAGFTDTSSALSTLTTAMNAYHMSAEEAEHISDSLITVQNLGVTTVAELSASMGKAIASASAYGVNLENLESAYISITKAGINTAEGTTYISSMLKELGDTGSDVSKVLQEVAGKSFDQLMAEGASLGDVLEILNASVDGDATALMNLWSSAEAGKASSAIVGQGITEFNANLETLQTTVGATESAFDTMADTLEYKLNVLTTTGENLMASLYEGLSGGLGDIVGFGTEIINQLSESFQEGGIEGLAFAFGDVVSQALQKVVEYIPSVVDIAFQLIDGLASGLAGGASSIASSATNIVGKFINGLRKSLPSVIKSGATIVQDLAIGIGEALPSLLTEATNLIVEVVNEIVNDAPMLLDGAIALIMGLREGLFEAVPVLIDALPSLIENVLNAVFEAIPMVIDAINTMMDQLVTNLPIIMDALINALPEIIQLLINGLIQYVPLMINGWIQIFTIVAQNMPTIIAVLIESIPQILLAICEGFSPLGDMLADLFRGIWEGIKSTFDDLKTIISEKIDDVGEFFATLPERIAFHLGEGLARFKEWITNLIEEAPNVRDNVINTVVGFFEELPSKIWTWLLDAVKKVTEWISDMKNKVATSLPEVITKITDTFKDLPQKMTDIGKNVIQGLWNGITSKFNELLEDLKSKVNSIKDAFTEGFDINSPSRWFKWVGEMCTEGFQIGIDDLTNGSIVNEVQNRIADGLQGIDLETGSGFGSVVYNQTINVNREIATADELARAIRIESRRGLMVYG